MINYKFISEKIKMIRDRMKTETYPNRFVIGYFLRHTKLCNLFKINMEGFKLNFYPTALSRTLWVNQKDYKIPDKFVYNYLQPTDVFVDIGANIGSFTLLGSVLVGDKGKVYSIEAHPKTYKYLVGNIKLNNAVNVVPINKGIGFDRGKVKFSSFTSDDQNSVVVDSGIDNFVEIDIVPLPDVFPQDKKINLLKIDVEGFELNVLKGCESIFKQIECIYYESWDNNYATFNYTSVDVINYLESFDFKIFKFKDNSIEKLEKGYTSNKLENLIAVNSFFLEDFTQRISNFK